MRFVNHFILFLFDIFWAGGFLLKHFPVFVAEIKKRETTEKNQQIKMSRKKEETTIFFNVSIFSSINFVF